MKVSKVFAVTALILAAASFSSKSSYAWGGGYYYYGGYGDGFWDGLIAALLTSETIQTNNGGYDDATLKVEAASYLDTQAEGPLFSAIVNDVANQLGQTPDQVDKASLSKLILTQGQN